MKKQLVALFLAVVLTVTFATPAFAGDPKGDMPDEGIAGLEKALPNIRWCMAGGFGWMNSQGPMNGQGLHRAYGSCIASLHVLRALAQDCPPGQTVP